MSNAHQDRARSASLRFHFRIRAALARRLFAAIVFAGLVAFSAQAASAQTHNEIRGSVRNGTSGEPAAGEQVALLRTDGSVKEAARTKTDGRGAFTFQPKLTGTSFLLRVTHDGVNYDQPVSPGKSVSLEIFDAAAEVAGISGTIEILRANSNRSSLHISDLYEIRNDSKPPITLAGIRTFDVYLPAEARISSVLAASPGEIAEMISASPAAREPGHYAVNFPLRPGATKFAFNYDLPYSGHVAFRTRRTRPFTQLAVMVPAGMTFSSPSAAFQVLPAGNPRYQVQAANQLAAGDGPVFEISGGGSPAPLDAMNPPPARSASATFSLAAVATPGARTPPTLAAVAAIPAQTHFGDTVVLLALSAIFFAACAWMLWRARKRALRRVTPKGSTR